MVDNSKQIMYSRTRKYSGRNRKYVKITQNMGAFLHYLLTSISYENDEFKFTPSDLTKEILNKYTYYDLVDTYSKLGLNNGLFGVSLVNKSRDYVNRKVLKIYELKHKRCDKQ